MKRMLSAAVLFALVLAVFGGTACSPKVEVRTGTKVVCTYGEVISDNIRTVKVPAEDAGKYTVRTVTRTCERHARLEALYRDAQKALVAGDLVAAKKLLGQVVAIDARYGKAASQLDALAKGEKPDSDTSTPQGSSPTTPTDKPGDTITGNPAESLLTWAPNSISGYSASKPTIDPLNIARDYVPAQGSDVVTFVIAAQQFSGSQLAKAGLVDQVKKVYTKDKSTFTTNGHDVYFGTDGRRFAAVGFVDGAVMVVLEMSAKPGQAPLKLRPALEAALEQLP